MILCKENLEWDKHYTYCIRDYIQAYEDILTKNKNKAQILDQLHLRPAGNDQESYNLLHLQINEVMNRANITPSPISKSIVR